jgi:hypothetical protein
MVGKPYSAVPRYNTLHTETQDINTQTFICIFNPYSCDMEKMITNPTTTPRFFSRKPRYTSRRLLRTTWQTPHRLAICKTCTRDISGQFKTFLDRKRQFKTSDKPVSVPEHETAPKTQPTRHDRGYRPKKQQRSVEADLGAEFCGRCV